MTTTVMKLGTKVLCDTTLQTIPVWVTFIQGHRYSSWRKSWKSSQYIYIFTDTVTTSVMKLFTKVLSGEVFRSCQFLWPSSKVSFSLNYTSIHPQNLNVLRQGKGHNCGHWNGLPTTAGLHPFVSNGLSVSGGISSLPTLPSLYVSHTGFALLVH